MPSGGCNASPATVTLEPWQRDSGHLAVSTPAGFSDTESGFNPLGRRRGYCQTTKGGAYRYQRVDLLESGKDHGGQAKISNRTW